jgi:hypothetical protein
MDMPTAVTPSVHVTDMACCVGRFVHTITLPQSCGLTSTIAWLYIRMSVTRWDVTPRNAYLWPWRRGGSEDRTKPTGVLRAGAPHHRVAEHLVHQTAYRTTTTHRGWSASLRRRQQRVRPPSAVAAPGAPASLLLVAAAARAGAPASRRSQWLVRQAAMQRRTGLVSQARGQRPTIPGYTGRICADDAAPPPRARRGGGGGRRARPPGNSKGAKLAAKRPQAKGVAARRRRCAAAWRRKPSCRC